MPEFDEVYNVLESVIDTHFVGVEAEESFEGEYVFTWDKNGFEYDMYVNNCGPECVQVCLRKIKARTFYVRSANTEFFATEETLYEGVEDAVNYIEEESPEMKRWNWKKIADAFF